MPTRGEAAYVQRREMTVFSEKQGNLGRIYR